MAVLYFGASHIQRGIYLDVDGETLLRADGGLVFQDCLNKWADVWSCWGCGGVGVLKMYLEQGYELVVCDICQGSKESGLMPPLKPRHIHDWQLCDEKCPPRFEVQRCDCGARWLKYRLEKAGGQQVAGFFSVSSLLKRSWP